MANESPLLSIVIPCYNEEGNLEGLIHKLESLSAKKGIEVILVDNGSTDSTPNRLPQLIKPFPFIRSVRVERNIGYGYGIKRGLADARGSTLAWTHADLQTDPMDVWRAYEAFRKWPDSRVLIKGRRRQRPLLDVFFTTAMQWFVLLMLRVRLSDINAQPKMFSRTFYNQLHQLPDDFSLDLYVLVMARKLNYKITTIPVDFGLRTQGEAKGGGSLRTKWKLTMRTVQYILKLKGTWA